MTYAEIEKTFSRSSAQSKQQKTKMENFNLCHTYWVCNYHVVWIHKYRKKKLFVAIRRDFGTVLHKLAEYRESRILEGHLMPDHVHILISILLKLSVVQVIGYMKGKRAIYITRNLGGRKRNFTGENFWARGYYVSTGGADEASVRAYIRSRRERERERRLEQLKLN